MARRWINALLFVMLAVYALYLSVGSFKPQTVLACELESHEARIELRLGSRSMAVSKILVEGRLSGDGGHGLYQFDGSARITGNAETNGSVSGAVFLAGDRAVEGLLLWISNPGFGRDQLSITTLNADGFLDRNRSTAFLFAEPRDRLKHPASFTCRSERNYRHIYEGLASFPWLAFIGLLVITWGVMFLARRKAEGTDFGRP